MQGRIDLLVVHPFLQGHDLARIGCAAVDGLPAFPQLGWVFEDSRMLEDTAGTCAIGKESRAVLLASQGHAHGIPSHRNGRVADKPVKAKPWNVQDILPAQFD